MVGWGTGAHPQLSSVLRRQHISRLQAVLQLPAAAGLVMGRTDNCIPYTVLGNCASAEHTGTCSLLVLTLCLPCSVWICFGLLTPAALARCLDTSVLQVMCISLSAFQPAAFWAHCQSRAAVGQPSLGVPYTSSVASQRNLELDMKMQQRNNTAKNRMQMCEYPEYCVTVSHHSANHTKLECSDPLQRTSVFKGAVASLLTAE